MIVIGLDNKNTLYTMGWNFFSPPTSRKQLGILALRFCVVVEREGMLVYVAAVDRKLVPV